METVSSELVKSIGASNLLAFLALGVAFILGTQLWAFRDLRRNVATKKDVRLALVNHQLQCAWRIDTSPHHGGMHQSIADGD